MQTALITSSRNAHEVLDAAGETGVFGVIIDGVEAEARELSGEPAPDVFLAAADELGLVPNRSIVVGDALSGVAAGAAGDFGLVTGVARHYNRDELLAAGADAVFPDLSAVSAGS